MMSETPLLFAVGVFLAALGLLIALFSPELAHRVDAVAARSAAGLRRLWSRVRGRRRLVPLPWKWARSQDSLKIQGNAVTVKEVES
ncbi:hypothetical protein [Actinacidiphila glaucinigra]|uniref:hypothetical protein n=1 Tax=Actinacidiphila glaucinigra TaxID=235986 RepID=UPI0029A97381|nr:hypothetical protein [Streptomyces sp. PA03-3a]